MYFKKRNNKTFVKNWKKRGFQRPRRLVSQFGGFPRKESAKLKTLPRLTSGNYAHSKRLIAYYYRFFWVPWSPLRLSPGICIIPSSQTEGISLRRPAFRLGTRNKLLMPVEQWTPHFERIESWSVSSEIPIIPRVLFYTVYNRCVPSAKVKTK